VRTLLGWLQGKLTSRITERDEIQARSGTIGTVNRKMTLFEAIIALINGTGGSREKMEASSNILILIAQSNYQSRSIYINME
jgi:hypothetical protein